TASAQEFAESASELIEGINEYDLVPGYSGLRPRLFQNQKPVTDFVIQESQPHFYHFLGFESPGLTCAPSLVTELPL
ncbi:MAG: FAD-dependent oxidoreductase, partial [Leptonema sp. (in: Bacteria)]|nr:FAD-dependent oxidoreductase [Leptonema sp. (in: bacteria)]